MSGPRRYVLAFDHGTSGLKTSLVDRQGRVACSAFEPTPIHFTDDGGAEQDPDDWWRALVKTARQVLGRTGGGAGAEELAAVCVSSTFSTTVAVDLSGRHVAPAMTWMDSRGAPHVKRRMRGLVNIQGYGLTNLIKWVPRTAGGPTLSGKDDVAHALFWKSEQPEVYDRAHKLLPSKDYLNMRLCGRAAATFDSIQLFWVTDTRDINNVRYDPRLIRALGLDRSKLPELLPSTAVLGSLLPGVAAELGLSEEAAATIQVVAGSPDHQAAGVGAGAVRDFEAHLYVGTSSWVQCVVPFKKTDVLHSIASLPTSVPGRYMTANEQDMAGGCLAWAAEQLLDRVPGEQDFRDLLDRAGDARPGCHGLFFLPWLNGERTPVDDHHLRGGWINMAKTHTRADLIRAVLEGVALNTRWSLGYVEKFVGKRLDPIRMVGGGARSDLWCQIFADVLNREILQLEDPICANARGAAFLAWIGLGELTFDELPELVSPMKRFTPNLDHRDLYDGMYNGFLELFQANRALFHKLNRGRS